MVVRVRALAAVLVSCPDLQVRVAEARVSAPLHVPNARKVLLIAVRALTTSPVRVMEDSVLFKCMSSAQHGS